MLFCCEPIFYYLSIIILKLYLVVVPKEATTCHDLLFLTFFFCVDNNSNLLPPKVSWRSDRNQYLHTKFSFLLTLKFFDVIIKLRLREIKFERKLVCLVIS